MKRTLLALFASCVFLSCDNPSSGQSSDSNIVNGGDKYVLAKSDIIGTWRSESDAGGVIMRNGQVLEDRYAYTENDFGEAIVLTNDSCHIYRYYRSDNYVECYCGTYTLGAMSLPTGGIWNIAPKGTILDLESDVGLCAGPARILSGKLDFVCGYPDYFDSLQDSGFYFESERYVPYTGHVPPASWPDSIEPGK